VPKNHFYIYKINFVSRVSVRALHAPRATTLYRTSQYISVLLHIIYTRSLSRSCVRHAPIPCRLCTPLYCSRSRVTTLYRTSQYISVLLYILYTSSSTRSVSYTHLAPLLYIRPLNIYISRISYYLPDHRRAPCPTRT
jgi:hypothetical protein